MTILHWKVLIALLSLLELYLFLRFVQATVRHRRIGSLTPVKLGDLQKRSPGQADWVAVEGTVSCQRPLKSRYEKTSCVFYRSEVLPDRRPARGWFSKSEGVLFELSDETGSVLVDPQDAEVLSAQVSVHKFTVHKRSGLVDSLVNPVLGEVFAQIGVTNQGIAQSDLEKNTRGKLKGSYLSLETVLAVGDTLFAVGQVKNVSGRPVLTSSGGGRGPTFLTNLSRGSYLRSLSRQAWKFFGGVVLNALVIAIVVTIGLHHGFVALP